MKKSTKKVLASADFPVVIAKTNGDIRVRAYTCKDSGQTVISNYMSSPFSPITGEKMIPVDKKVLTITEDELDSFEDLGTCPECGSKLAVTEEIADDLVDNNIHCIVCGEELKVNDISPNEYDQIKKENDQKSYEKGKNEDFSLDTTEVTSEDDFSEEVERSKEDEIKMIKEARKDLEKKSPYELGDIYFHGDIPEGTNLDKDELIDGILEDRFGKLAEDEINEDIISKCLSESTEEPFIDSETVQEPPVESEETPEEELNEVRVDLLSKVMSGLNSKKINIIPSGKDSLYYLMVSNKPVASLHKSRASLEVQDLWDNLPMVEKSFKAAIEDKEPLKELSSTFGLVPVILKVKASEVIEKAIQDKLDEKIEEVNSKNEEDKEAYDQSVGIAAVGINKNIFEDTENILAKNLISELENIGVEDAKEIVERCFENYGDEYIRLILSKAEEFKEKSPEVRNEIASTIAGAKSKSLNLNHKVKASVKIEEKPISEEDVNFYKSLF